MLYHNFEIILEAVWDIPTRPPLNQSAHRSILETTIAERMLFMETGFWIFMLVMDFLLPLIMVVFGKLFQHCPEEINSVFGYRTRRSMASQEAWNFAHHACGKLWFRWGLVLLPVTVGLMLLVWGRDTGTVGLFGAVVMVVQLAVLLLSVAVVENALKRTFGEER